MTALDFSPDGRRLVTGDGTGWVHIRSLDDGRALARFRVGSTEIQQVALDAAGHRLFVGDIKGNLSVWALNPPRQLHSLRFPSTKGLNYRGVRFALDRVTRHIAVASTSDSIAVFSPELKPVRRYSVAGQTFSAVAFSHNGKQLFAASDRTKGIVGWDLGSGYKSLTVASMDAMWATQLEAPRGLGVLAVAGPFSEVQLIDVRTGKARKTLDGELGHTLAMAVSPDGRLIASGGGNYVVDEIATGYDVILWDASKGKRIQVLKGHLRPVIALAFSKDGRYLASAAMDAEVRVWRMPR